MRAAIPGGCPLMKQGDAPVLSQGQRGVVRGRIDGQITLRYAPAPLGTLLQGTGDLRRLVIELLKPLPAEVDVKHLITGLWSLGVAPGLRAASLGGRRSGAALVLTHQGKSSASDERKEDQVDSSQKVVQGWESSFDHPSATKC